MVALSGDHSKSYFLKPRRGKIAEKVYSPQSLQVDEKVVENILLLHAFSGCDTRSALFGKGKANFLKVLQNFEKFNQTFQVFKEEIVCPEDIAAAREKFLSGTYISLDSLRYQQSTRTVTKSKINLASLPPTAEAAQQHPLCTYHQVQTWHGIMKNGERRELRFNSLQA